MFQFEGMKLYVQLVLRKKKKGCKKYGSCLNPCKWIHKWEWFQATTHNANTLLEPYDHKAKTFSTFCIEGIFLKSLEMHRIFFLEMHTWGLVSCSAPC